MKQNHGFLLLSVALLFMPLSTSSQTSEQRARILVQQTLKASTNDKRLLNFMRREDLEQIFQSLRSLSRSWRDDDLIIFEIRDRGYQFSDQGVSYFLSVPGDARRVVAVMTESDEVFRIAGFQDSQQEFNNLARAAQLNLNTELQAREYAGLYVELDPANYRLTETSTFLTLKQLGERRFAQKYGDFLLRGQTDSEHDKRYKKYLLGEAKFERWWSNKKEELASLPFGEEISKTALGFETHMLTLSDLDDRAQDSEPAVLRVTLRFSSSGEADPPVISPLFQAASKPRVGH